jgi:hypothetical protein
MKFLSGRESNSMESNFCTGLYVEDDSLVLVTRSQANQSDQVMSEGTENRDELMDQHLKSYPAVRSPEDSMIETI